MFCLSTLFKKLSTILILGNSHDPVIADIPLNPLSKRDFAPGIPLLREQGGDVFTFQNEKCW